MPTQKTLKEAQLYVKECHSKLQQKREARSATRKKKDQRLLIKKSSSTMGGSFRDFIQKAPSREPDTKNSSDPTESKEKGVTAISVPLKRKTSVPLQRRPSSQTVSKKNSLESKTRVIYCLLNEGQVLIYYCVSLFFPPQQIFWQGDRQVLMK